MEGACPGPPRRGRAHCVKARSPVAADRPGAAAPAAPPSAHSTNGQSAGAVARDQTVWLTQLEMAELLMPPSRTSPCI